MVIVIVVVQSLNCAQFFAILWTVACQTPLPSTIPRSLLKFIFIESVMLSNHLILRHPFSSCPQSFPASGSFPVCWPFTSGGQSTGASALASVLPMNIQGQFLLGLTGLISLQSKIASFKLTADCFLSFSSSNSLKVFFYCDKNTWHEYTYLTKF